MANPGKAGNSGDTKGGDFSGRTNPGEIGGTTSDGILEVAEAAAESAREAPEVGRSAPLETIEGSATPPLDRSDQPGPAQR